MSNHFFFFRTTFKTETMSRCIIEGCLFYGLPANDGKCTVCAGINVLPIEATEEDVMEVFKLTLADLPSEIRVQERLAELEALPSSIIGRIVSLFQSTDTPHWPVIAQCDNENSVETAWRFLRLGPRLRSETCRQIMNQVTRACDRTTTIAFSKALVRGCIAPWKLKGVSDFSVGLCYFGFGNGCMVTRRSLERLRDSGAVLRSVWTIPPPPPSPIHLVCRRRLLPDLELEAVAGQEKK